jgi:hypothetical protein
MWLNVHGKFPQPPADPAANLCNECFKLTLHENPEPPVSEDQSEVRQLGNILFDLKRSGIVLKL